MRTARAAAGPVPAAIRPSRPRVGPAVRAAEAPDPPPSAVPPRRSRTSGALAPAAVLGLLLSAGCGAAQPPAVSPGAGYQYSCCRAADVASPRHPGEVVTIHWIVRAVRASGPGGPVTLTVRLDGPFSSVGKLKGNAEPAATLVAATPVHTTDRAGGHPTSTFTIPADAKPGYYDLVAEVRSAGDEAGSGSVIRVVAP